ncbi:MAG TPA: lycopene cyclase [Cytophagales bacterium]|jgi:lycopene beta-cyclase|nr:lycopene cyclase [Cytophagales bacterium]
MYRDKFDIIIAGAGCAGLSLAYKIHLQSELKLRVLLVDKDPKEHNDRTWSFWEKSDNLFSPIAARVWDQIEFGSAQSNHKLSIAPYQYKLIRGIDFYNFIKKALGHDQRFEWHIDDIQRVDSNNTIAQVHTIDHTFQAEWVFNSIVDRHQMRNQPAMYLMQHFIGWEVKTSRDCFDDDIPVFMDFSIAPGRETHFMYVLPFSKNKAIVEYTAFSEELLSTEAYEEGIRSYLKNRYKCTDFEIISKEQGIIPMTDAYFQRQPQPRVINIGTAGGDTRGSTGYTFLNIQSSTDEIVELLLQHKKPLPKASVNLKYQIYDSTLLRVLHERKIAGASVFDILFQNNKTTDLLAFLDNSSNILTDLKIMTSVPIHIFLPAALKSFGKHIPRLFKK